MPTGLHHLLALQTHLSQPSLDLKWYIKAELHGLPAPSTMPTTLQLAWKCIFDKEKIYIKEYFYLFNKSHFTCMLLFVCLFVLRQVLAMQFRLASSLQSSCLCLPSAGITGVCHHTSSNNIENILSAVIMTSLKSILKLPSPQT
jgi:hypothetical protein